MDRVKFNDIAQKIDELSLLLVMLDLGDSVGLAAALELSKQLSEEAGKIADGDKLSNALAYVVELSASAEPAVVYDALKETVSSAQGFLQGVGGVVFPFEKNCSSSRIEANKSGNNKEGESIPLEMGISEDQNIQLGEPYLISADSEILSEFMAEADDHLQAVESILLEKESDFTLEDTDTIFRGVHSLKGTSGYFNLLEINESSHLLENILDEVRSGKRELELPLKELVLRYVDIQRKLMDSAKIAVASGSHMQRNPEAAIFVRDIEDFFHGRTKGASVESAAVVMEGSPAIDASNEIKPQSISETTIEVEAKRDSVQVVKQKESKEVVQKTPTKDSSIAKTFIKIDTERLDSLGEMIGEMVIYSSMLVRKCRESLGFNEDIMRMSDQVEKFSRELQDIGMSMRLDPIKGLFQKMTRLVWDTSKKLGKEVDLQLKGEDTELDRNVIERLADPLMHMVRNSLDHGIEPPDVRIASGKDKQGTVVLSASHEGGNIVIKISDDGRGLDPERLFAKAVQKGIIKAEERLTEQEILELIFAPGFSTAEQVTDISGRGVGMDVVRTNIEGMRGRVKIQSELGKGSVFTIELPLTLAIIEGIEAAVGEEKFIIPTLSVVELMRPSEELIGTALHTGETFYFRGKHLPLFRISDIFEIESELVSPWDGIVVVVENSGEQVALLVDEILGSCQTVIKNLGPMFERQTGIAGCAIMPNGDIGLIVDVRSLIVTARENSKKNESVRRFVLENAEGVSC